LAGEQEEVVELEMPLEREERAPLHPLQRRQLGLGREERCERREVQRHVREGVLARPLDRLADEPLVEPVRGRAQPRHRRERKRGPASGRPAASITASSPWYRAWSPWPR